MSRLVVSQKGSCWLKIIGVMLDSAFVSGADGEVSAAAARADEIIPV